MDSAVQLKQSEIIEMIAREIRLSVIELRLLRCPDPRDRVTLDHVIERLSAIA